MTGRDELRAHELAQHHEQRLAELEAAGLLRRLTDPAQNDLVDFTSNDMLGLAGDPRVREAAARAARDHGAGARAARLLGGGSPLHAAAEQSAVEWIGAEAALLFPSGYQANLGVLGALCERGDAILSDELVHASLIDAARLARADVHVHRHGDLEHVERLLERARGARRRWIVTEGVFSMDGDTPDLCALAELADRHDAWLIVDEAHAAGVVGPDGRGAWAAVELQAPPRCAARVVTGGKALGAAGAFVLAERSTVEWLANRARSFVFSTAPPPAVAGALCASIPLAADADGERARLHTHARRVAQAVGAAHPAGAIVPCAVGDARAAVALAEALTARGFDLRAVRPPTVPPGTSRLRCVVRAGHGERDIDRLCATLGELLSAARSAEVERTPGDAPPTPRTSPRSGGTPRLPTHAARTTFGDPTGLDRGRCLVVVGTDTDVGKTVASAVALSAARRRGPAVYWKPVQTGSDSDTEVVRRLARANRETLAEPLRHDPLPASPDQAARAAGGVVPVGDLTPKLVELARAHPGGRLVVELAGGLLVPYDEDVCQIDWLQALGDHVSILLVARSGLGTLNHTLLSLEALRARGLEPKTLVLCGPPHAENRRCLEARGRVGNLVELPPLEPLDADTVSTWLDGADLDAWLP